MSDSRIEREREAALSAALDRLGGPAGEGSLSALVQTTVETTYPTSANTYYAVNPVEIDGGQSEGDTPTFTADVTRTYHAYNLGSAIPPEGSIVVAHSRAGRWFFTFNCCVS